MKDDLVSKNPYSNIDNFFDPNDKFTEVEIKFEDNLFKVVGSDDRFYTKFGFGRKISSNYYLSSYEVFFIHEVLNSLKSNFTTDELWKICCGLSHNVTFAHNYVVYRYYRVNLWLVRDGSIFGFNFALYIDHPDRYHSSYLVSIYNSWDNFDNNIINDTRIAYSVNKKVIFCVIVPVKPLDYDCYECIYNLQVQAIDAKRLDVR